MSLWCFSSSLQELSVSNGPEAQTVHEEEEQDEQGDGSEDEWEQVGPRNKSSVTRQADFVQTPITDIFGGHIRYFFIEAAVLPLQINFPLLCFLYFSPLLDSWVEETVREFVQARRDEYSTEKRLLCKRVEKVDKNDRRIDQ